MFKLELENVPCYDWHNYSEEGYDEVVEGCDMWFAIMEDKSICVDGYNCIPGKPGDFRRKTMVDAVEIRADVQEYGNEFIDVILARITHVHDESTENGG